MSAAAEIKQWTAGAFLPRSMAKARADLAEAVSQGRPVRRLHKALISRALIDAEGVPTLEGVRVVERMSTPAEVNRGQHSGPRMVRDPETGKWDARPDQWREATRSLDGRLVYLVRGRDAVTALATAWDNA